MIAWMGPAESSNYGKYKEKYDAARRKYKFLKKQAFWLTKFSLKRYYMKENTVKTEINL